MQCRVLFEGFTSNELPRTLLPLNKRQSFVQWARGYKSDLYPSFETVFGGKIAAYKGPVYQKMRPINEATYIQKRRISASPLYPILTDKWAFTGFFSKNTFVFLDDNYPSFITRRASPLKPEHPRIRKCDVFFEDATLWAHSIKLFCKSRVKNKWSEKVLGGAHLRALKKGRKNVYGMRSLWFCD